MTNFMDLVLKRMNIHNVWQFIIIIIVFAVTGSLALVATMQFMEYINISSQNSSPFLFWPVRVIFLFIIYQILLLLTSIPFGQFKYFWQFEKKILGRFGIKL